MSSALPRVARVVEGHLEGQAQGAVPRPVGLLGVHGAGAVLCVQSVSDSEREGREREREGGGAQRHYLLVRTRWESQCVDGGGDVDGSVSGAVE
eukprot:1346702-Pleurochrysis_carterae.AAC.1